MSAGEVRPEGVAVFRGLIIAFAVSVYVFGMVITLVTMNVTGLLILSAIATVILWFVRDRSTPEEREWRAVSAYFDKEFVE